MLFTPMYKCCYDVKFRKRCLYYYCECCRRSLLYSCHYACFQIHLSFSLDRDPELDEESKAESEGNIVIRAILNILNHFASIIGSAKDTELKYVTTILQCIATRSELASLAHSFVRESSSMPSSDRPLLTTIIFTIFKSVSTNVFSNDSYVQTKLLDIPDYAACTSKGST